MNNKQVAKFLFDQGVGIDPETLEDPLKQGRDPIRIGVEMGLIGLKHLGTDMTGSYDREDIEEMRRGGYVVLSVAFGQAVYEAVPAAELEV